MSIYSILIDKTEQGMVYRIDLKQKTLRINGKYYMKEGELRVDNELISKEEIGDNPWDMISSLFRNYQKSVPNRHDKNNGYFKALNVDELSISDLACNEPRNLAQAKLEGYILLASLVGAIEWPNENHWFWQDPANAECIILKEWVK